MNSKLNRQILLGGSISAGIVMVGALWLLLAPIAGATEAFAKQTGMACGQCHTSPEGGGALTPFGTKFQANGNKVPK
jgi:hypothetical protein